MLFSSLPVSVLAEEIAEIIAEVQAGEIAEIDESKIGNEVTVGDSMYYIEDGNLLLSVDYARPQVIATDVFWVVEDNGNVYYAKYNENNTYIYKAGKEKEFVILYCHIDCFDVDEGDVYYIYGRTVYKYNLTDSSTESVYADDNARKFHICEGEVVLLSDYSAVENSILDNEDIEMLASYPISDAKVTEIVEEYMSIIGTGRYWNAAIRSDMELLKKQARNKEYKKATTAYPCKCIPKHLNSEGGLDGCSSNVFTGLCGGSSQCWGFGDYIEYVIFRSSQAWDKSGWTKHSSVTSSFNFRPGDYIFSRKNSSSQHIRVVYKVENNNVYVIEGNWDGKCGIRTAILENPHSYVNYRDSFVLTPPKTLRSDCSECEKIGTSAFKGKYEVVVDEDDKGNKFKIHARCKSCKTTISNDYLLNDKEEKNDGKAGIWRRKSYNYFDLYFRGAPYATSKPDTLIDKQQYETLNVLGQVTRADGEKWFKVDINGQKGYIFADKVEKDFKQDPVSLVAGDEGLRFPHAKMNLRQSFPLRGKIRSNEKNVTIKKVTGYILNSDGTSTGKPHSEMSTTVNAVEYEIKSGSTIDKLRFGELESGVYFVRYVVETSDGKKYTFNSYDYSNGDEDNYRGYFTVGNGPEIRVSDLPGGKRVTYSAGAEIHYTINGGKEKTISSGKSIDLNTAGDYSIKAWTSSTDSKTIAIHLPKAVQPNIWENIRHLIGLADVDIGVDYGKNCAYAIISGDGDLYYTTNGTVPTANSAKYVEPIPLQVSTTIKAISIQKGCAPSDVVTKEIIIKEPDPPVISLYNTKPKIAQGKTASVSWEPVKYTTNYTAYLYLDGKEIEKYETTGNMASFNLSKRSDTENFEYTIKVVAENFVGPSEDSNAVTVTAMHPVKVTFVDRITRTGELTETKLQEVKERINEHEKNDRGYKLEGQVISVQKVDYDTLPSKPAVPSKKGFEFSGWSGEMFQPAVADTTVYADFEIKYYTVKFYDMDNNFNRSSKPILDERYMYTDSVVPPNNHETAAGYKISGWTLDVVNSEGTGYDYVDGDMVYDMACQWENVDLPTLVEITKVTRDDNSYYVDVRIKNTNESETLGRIVVALYTAEGRHVYSAISDKDLPIGKYIEWTDIDGIRLNYNQKITCAKAYVVGVENDKTCGALSPETEKSVCYDIELAKDSNFWSGWSDYSETKIEESDTVQVEKKIQYRYRDLQSTTRTDTNYLNGWGWAYHTDVHTGNWINNGSNYIAAIDTVSLKREVPPPTWTPPEKKTQYRYGRWSCGNWWHFCRETAGSGYWYDVTSWQDWAVTPSAYEYYYCGNTSHDHRNPASYKYNRHNWNQYKVNGGTYYWQETQEVDVKAGYNTYIYRDTTYTYHFKRYGGWSEWLDSYPTGGDSNRQVETRTLYRYRECVYDPDSESEAPSLVNEYDPIEGVLDTSETEYITEEEYNTGDYAYIGGPYYKNDDGEYIEIENQDVTEYKYGRYTNGTYVMPCKELAEELYGGEWEVEYTDWTRKEAETINENVYYCEIIGHMHSDATQKDDINYWNEYVIDGKSYCFVESRVLNEEITYTDTNKYYLVNKNLEGKVATVLAYKKINTDPTQGQLQYASQIKIGRGNTYHIEINPKEMVEYESTGDFVVSLALEGSRRLITVGVIKAEPPKHEVNFFVNGEAYIPETNKTNYEIYDDEEDGISKYKEIVDGEEVERFANAVYVPEGEAVDVNDLGIPEIEGYRFVKWDKSLVNITGKMDVNAVLEKEDYVIVFVDHANETVELQELYYGDPIAAPDVLPVEGKVFKGWDNQSYRYVLESEKDNASYKVVDGPYYKTTDESYIPVDEHTDEELVNGTKYYRVLIGEIPIVTGNMVITAIWEPIIYNVTFCDMEGNVIHEEEVEYGEAATPPECIVEGGVQMPWSTNGKAWWNVTEDMTIYPYVYVPNDIVSPVSSTASGTYKNGQVVYLESQEDTPIYYSVNVEFTQTEIQEYIIELEEQEANPVFEEVSMLSLIEYTGDVGSGEGYSVSDYISEYTEPIVVNESSIIYAFTVKEGKVSPISVYRYEIDEFFGNDEYEINPDTPQITMPNITAKPGETVTVPVSIKNNPGVSDLSLVFGYDTNNLTLLKAENGDVFNKSEYSSDLRDDGSCKFTWLSSTENTNDGILLSLQFKVGENGGNYSIDMSIEEAKTSEEEMPFVTKDGSIENIGDSAQMGDTNGDGNINFADAIIILRHDIGFAELSNYQKSISDVNGDGDVDFADAIKILRFDAGFISSLK